MKTRAAVMTKPNSPIEVQEVELAKPGPNECLVKIEATSVCASDVNGWMDETAPVPCILGHEGAGEIMEVGADVKDLKVGDKVVLSWIPYCGSCVCCTKGKPQLCTSIVLPMNTGTLMDGSTRFSKNNDAIYHFSFLSTFSQYSVVPEKSCVKLKKEIPADVRALFGCGVATGYGAAVKAAHIDSDSTVIVFGLGMVGISAIQGAMIQGAKKIIGCDNKAANIEPLQKLKHFADVEFIDSTDPNLARRIAEATNAHGVDVAIDATGSTRATRQVFELMTPGGEIVVVGAYHEGDLTLPAPAFHRRGISVKGSFYGDMDPFAHFDELAEHYLNGKLNFDGLITKEKSLEDMNEIFSVFRNPKTPNFGRYLIHPNGAL